MQILNEKGIENAAALLGGTAAWEKAGYPMESETPNTDNKNAQTETKQTPPAKLDKSANNQKQLY